MAGRARGRRGPRWINPEVSPELTGADRRRHWRRRWNPWQRLFAVGFGTLCLGYGVSNLFVEDAVSAHEATATATVEHVSHYSKSPDTVTVDFTTATEQDVTTDVQAFAGYHVGQTIEVEYDARHPTRARIKGDGGQALSGWLFGGLGIVLVAMAFRSRRWFHRVERRR